MNTPERSTSFRGNATRRNLDVVAVTQDLVRIPSDGSTDKVLSYVEGITKTHDLQSTRISAGTPGLDSLLVGKNIDQIPSVLAVCHIDTTPGWAEGEYAAYGGIIADGLLYGRGSSDSKGSAAAMLVAILEQRRNMPDSFGLLLTSDEEGELRGVQASREHFRGLQGASLIKSPRLMIGGGNNGEYGTGSRGILEAEVTVRGGGGHGAFGIVGADSIDGSNSFVEALKAKISTVPVDSLLGGVTLNRGGLIGGNYSAGENGPEIKSTVNMRPDISKTKFSLRLTGQKLDGQAITPAVIQDLIRQDVEGNGLELAEYKPLAYIDGAVVDPERIKWVLDKVNAKIGTTLVPIDYPKRGFDESLFLLDVFGTDLGFAFFGPGDKSKYHKVDESVSVDNLRNYAEIYGDVFTDPSLK